MTDIEVREVDVDDDAELRALYEAIRDGDQAGRGGMPYWSEHEFFASCRIPMPGLRQSVFAAFDGDRVVGGGIMELPLEDNLDKAEFRVAVPPSERGRGVGTALEAYAAAIARREGRPTVLTSARVPPDGRDEHPYRLFAEHRGYRVANVELERRLDLPVAEERLTELAEAAAAHHADYRIETYVDDVPEELIPSFCELLGLLAHEAPTGDIEFEPEVVTRQMYDAMGARLREQGRTTFITLAIDASGQAVANTVLAVPAHDPGNVYQWATLVRPEHRGHRLGLAVKVHNLRAMQAANPDRRRIWTCNAEVNANMVAINEALGFTPVELVLEFQRTSELAGSGMAAMPGAMEGA